MYLCIKMALIVFYNSKKNKQFVLSLFIFLFSLNTKVNQLGGATLISFWFFIELFYTVILLKTIYSYQSIIYSCSTFTNILFPWNLLPSFPEKFPGFYDFSINLYPLSSHPLPIFFSFTSFFLFFFFHN